MVAWVGGIDWADFETCGIKFEDFGTQLLEVVEGAVTDESFILELEGDFTVLEVL